MKSKDKKKNNFSVKRTPKQKSPNFTLGEWELLECTQGPAIEPSTDISNFDRENVIQNDLTILNKDRDLDRNISVKKTEGHHAVGAADADSFAVERVNYNMSTLPALPTQRILTPRSPSFSKPFPANPVNRTGRNISTPETALQCTENHVFGSLPRKSSKSNLVQIGHGAYFQKSEKSEKSVDENPSEKAIDRTSEKSLEKISNRAKSGLISDQSFLLTGSSIKKRTILFIDECCTKLVSSLLLQRYGNNFFEYFFP